MDRIVSKTNAKLFPKWIISRKNKMCVTDKITTKIK